MLPVKKVIKRKTWKIINLKNFLVEKEHKSDKMALHCLIGKVKKE